MKTKYVWFAAVLAAALTVPLHAAGIWDNGSSNGRWDTALNWDDDAVPTSSIVAFIQNEAGLGACLIDSATTANASIIRINGTAPAVTAPGKLVMTGGSLTSQRLFVGDIAGMTAPAMFQMSGGTVNLTATATNGFVIGNVAGSQGKAVISGNSSLTTGHNVIVGGSGSGELYLSNNAVVKATGSGPITIGSAAGSTGYLEINDSAKLQGTGSGNMTIGHTGNGTAVVNGGELSTAGSLYLAFTSGKTGNLTINGGLVSSNGIMYIGSSGSSTVLINGGALKATSNNINLGRYGTASSGTVVINNGASMEGGLAINIGYEGVGTITVNSGGILKATSATTANRNINLGYVAGSSGTLIIDGGYVEAADQVNIGLAGSAFGDFKNNGVLRFFDLNVKAVANTVLIDGYFTFQSSVASESGWATIRDKIIGYINNGYIAKAGGGSLVYTVNNTPGQYAINFVPEPATLAILGIGSMFMLRRNRR